MEAILNRASVTRTPRLRVWALSATDMGTVLINCIYIVMDLS
jgi:hypothetical protein